MRVIKRPKKVYIIFSKLKTILKVIKMYAVMNLFGPFTKPKCPEKKAFYES